MPPPSNGAPFASANEPRWRRARPESGNQDDTSSAIENLSTDPRAITFGDSRPNEHRGGSEVSQSAAPMGSLRSALALTALAAACQAPQIEKSGAGQGGDGVGGAGGAAGGAGGTQSHTPDFTVTFPDGGGRDTGGAEAQGTDDGKSCAGELHEGKLVAADLLFLLDTSGSMEESAGPKSKWMSVRNAIESFVADPQSAGLGVGLETFPVPSKLCQKDGECGGGKEICGRKGACSPPAKVATVQAA